MLDSRARVSGRKNTPSSFLLWYGSQYVISYDLLAKAPPVKTERLKEVAEAFHANIRRALLLGELPDKFQMLGSFWLTSPHLAVKLTRKTLVQHYGRKMIIFQWQR